jgi:dipeptidase
LPSAVLSFAASAESLNCYTVLVGKNASADGSVMIAHNEDDRGDIVVTSDSCGSRETKGELTEGGIGYMLRRLLAERTKSAREAVLPAGELIEKFGYRASDRTYSIVDRNEAWMLAAELRGPRQRVHPLQ